MIYTKSSMNRLMAANREKVRVGKDCQGLEQSRWKQARRTWCYQCRLGWDKWRTSERWAQSTLNLSWKQNIRNKPFRQFSISKQIKLNQWWTIRAKQRRVRNLKVPNRKRTFQIVIRRTSNTKIPAKAQTDSQIRQSNQQNLENIHKVRHKLLLWKKGLTKNFARSPNRVKSIPKNSNCKIMTTVINYLWKWPKKLIITRIDQQVIQKRYRVTLKILKY